MAVACLYETLCEQIPFSGQLEVLGLGNQVGTLALQMPLLGVRTRSDAAIKAACVQLSASLFRVLSTNLSWV